jgi:hypothetical protein
VVGRTVTNEPPDQKRIPRKNFHAIRRRNSPRNTLPLLVDRQPQALVACNSTDSVEIVINVSFYAHGIDPVCVFFEEQFSPQAESAASIVGDQADPADDRRRRSLIAFIERKDVPEKWRNTGSDRRA